MARINLIRKSNTYDSQAGSYKMLLEIVSTENVAKDLFIKQRLRNFVKNNFEDVFCAVATPAQVEEFDINSPRAGDSFFRTNIIELVSRNANYLENVFQSILKELQKLVEDVEALENLKTDGVYSITSADVEINDRALIHTHYRIPLIARPAGENEIYTDGGEEYHRVANQDTDLQGWINNVSPAQYKFKYNLAADTTLAALWPPSEELIGYAHLEVDGITIEAPYILINENGIYWKNNTKGNAPWPEDYVDVDDQGTEILTLVLDFVK